MKTNSGAVTGVSGFLFSFESADVNAFVICYDVCLVAFAFVKIRNGPNADIF